jgi:hypothetical protein
VVLGQEEAATTQHHFHRIVEEGAQVLVVVGVAVEVESLEHLLV